MIDRRQDKWSSVQASILRIAVSCYAIKTSESHVINCIRKLSLKFHFIECLAGVFFLNQEALCNNCLLPIVTTAYVFHVQ